MADCKERLLRVREVPVEIALPSGLEDFIEQRHLLLQVKRQIRDFEIPVRSVYAPHGRLADETFRKWAAGVTGFAEAVGAEIVVFHPERTTGEGRQGSRETAVRNIKLLQERTHATIAVETFWEDDRVLTPDEIMGQHLPMVLDTSLVPKPEIIWILESYHSHVKNVHLSAVVHDEQCAAMRLFRPVDNDPFCLDILDRLQELEWKGVVTLEYMPWLCGKSMEDRHLLERIYRCHQAGL